MLSPEQNKQTLTFLSLYSLPLDDLLSVLFEHFVVDLFKFNFFGQYVKKQPKMLLSISTKNSYQNISLTGIFVFPDLRLKMF